MKRMILVLMALCFVTGLVGCRENMSADTQIKLLSQKMTEFSINSAYEECYFTLGDLNDDSEVELIVSCQGGSGLFSTTHVYKIDKQGDFVEFDYCYNGYESEPDIIGEDLQMYSVREADGIRNYYVTEDHIRSGISHYTYRVSLLTFQNDCVLEIPMAKTEHDYECQDSVSFIDADGNEITEDQFENCVDRYFENDDVTRYTVHFEWIFADEILGKSQEEIEKILGDCYRNFSKLHQE